MFYEVLSWISLTAKPFSSSSINSSGVIKKLILGSHWQDSVSRCQELPSKDPLQDDHRGVTATVWECGWSEVGWDWVWPILRINQEDHLGWKSDSKCNIF